VSTAQASVTNIVFPCAVLKAPNEAGPVYKTETNYYILYGVYCCYMAVVKFDVSLATIITTNESGLIATCTTRVLSSLHFYNCKHNSHTCNYYSTACNSLLYRRNSALHYCCKFELSMFYLQLQISTIKCYSNFTIATTKVGSISTVN